MQEALKKMKELPKTLNEKKEVVKEEEPAENENVKKFMKQLNGLTNVTKHQKKIINNPHSKNKYFRPRENFAPPPKRIFTYAPAENAPKTFLKCYYCSEEGHSTRGCTELIEDQNKKWVIRKGFNNLYPNCKRVLNDEEFSPKYLVREFQKGQE
ncbi:hypothetical protein O181_006317 [Austropuccinia psidii MF-1]|uniref:CCHC-type domain-containing protein n=1 Tax=Austropuccinia psidii MF-1 TaxID=1389203 RepID=A0A9Q3GHH9_9BASI|nr:hypothetical protein [Austropuccinia psidii MF-1]